MNSLYSIVRHPGIYAALSVAPVLLVMGIVGWAVNRGIESELDLSLLRTLGSYAATLEGGTTNSRAMGAAILFGQGNLDAKQLALGKLPLGAPKVTGELDMLRELYTADTVILTDRQGIVVAYSNRNHISGTGHDLSFRPYVQQALQGVANVYAGVGIIAKDRGIFLSAPVRATTENTSAPIGAVVVKIGAEKLDTLLKSWTDGIAVLVSPQGVVFGASRDGWLFRASGEMSAERLAAIRRTRQFGAVFEASPILAAPANLDAREASLDGVRYAVSSQQLEWNDPEGDWRLTFLERRAPWWTHASTVGLAALAGVIAALSLFWLYSLARNALLLENMNAWLRRNAALLRESQLIAGLGFYSLDAASGRIESSDVLDKLFGVDADYERSIEGWTALVHPDDRAVMTAYLSEALGRGKPFDREYRIIRRNDGAERWVHGLGRLERGADGQPLALRGTVQDITARKHAEQEIHEAMRQLEQKELAKSRFLAAAGHDLRQPLAAANLFIEALKFSGPTPGQDQIIQRLDQAMGTFHGLLETLLDISRLDAGIIKPESAPVSVVDLMGWVDQSFAGLANEKKLRLKLHFPMKHALAVKSDIGLVKSALMNLVSNAIKFTPQGGILVAARRRGRDVLFQVWDTGVGIPEASIGQIYDEFYQVGNPQRDRTSGLGLGLSIAKRALALLGADIACRSEVGRGTVFAFRLPLDDTPEGGPQQSAAPAAKESAGDTLAQGRRFVVVEDDGIVAQAMTVLLESMGAEVKCFQSAEDALRDASIERADYFIADYMLSGKLNGIQFLNQVRAKLGTPIKGVLMTGDTSPSFLAESTDSAWTVLHKPVNLSRLMESLAALE